jgi:hypothetical protein
MWFMTMAQAATNDIFGWSQPVTAASGSFVALAWAAIPIAGAVVVLELIFHVRLETIAKSLLCIIVAVAILGGLGRLSAGFGGAAAAGWMPAMPGPTLFDIYSDLVGFGLSPSVVVASLGTLYRRRMGRGR